MKISETVAIVLNGDFSEPDDLWAWTAEADVVVATDGAADMLMSLGIKPDYVLGDLDSVRPETLSTLPADSVRRESDQDSTDFQKALRFATETFKPRSIAVLAYEGHRVDHMLSALFTVPPAFTSLRFVGKEAQALVLIAGNYLLTMPIGNRISLLPLGEVVIESGKGLRFSVDGVTLAIGGKDGISNVATESEVTLKITLGKLLAFIQRFEGETHW